MDEKPKVRRTSARAPDHARLAARLSLMLRRQIDALEEEPVDGYSEAKVKALLLLAKALQAMQEASGQDSRKNEREAGDRDTRDLLEFRNELERRIASLGPLGPDEGMAGDAGPVPGTAAG